MSTDDDEFLRLMQEADLDVDMSTTTDYSKIETPELRSMLRAVKEELYARGEMLHPHTPKARELHSQRLAITIVLRGRGHL